MEAQGAQSGEEAGSDAEASQNSGSDGEGGDGEEEVNEEEALEKFIDEGGKLSDLDSGSEGGASRAAPHELSLQSPMTQHQPSQAEHPVLRSLPKRPAWNLVERCCSGNIPQLLRVVCLRRFLSRSLPTLQRLPRWAQRRSWPSFRRRFVALRSVHTFCCCRTEQLACCGVESAVGCPPVLRKVALLPARRHFSTHLTFDFAPSSGPQRNKDKTSKKEKERQMAEEQKRFERCACPRHSSPIVHAPARTVLSDPNPFPVPPAPNPLRPPAANARFEGAEFEKKDLGGILAKFKARFEELPAPPPKDVVRRRGSTGRPQPIAVSLEELEDMIAVRARRPGTALRPCRRPGTPWSGRASWPHSWAALSLGRGLTPGSPSGVSQDEGVVDDGDGEMIVIQEAR